ncbi:glycosyltransferase family 1 protein [Paenibacillus sp. F6_3S_P_1C]|uniref:Glycosyltransferase family 1 protein n=1 Tax=Paenibacillus vandeheii TaxID=3035917 RepID=A0ABT8JGG2_9BACL|nr:glycosyltransferase family 1 protein [Paenibacillus vandeheii]MDN4604125.1 glycosyltransferase family 1 protein [Paenibacillus vandeheii]
MRLALFTDTYVPDTNGVAGTLHRLSNQLNRKGIEHLLLTPQSVIEGNHAAPARSVTNIPFFLYPECRIALPNRRSIHQELKAFQPDLLHIATPFNMGLLGLRYALKHQLPHVISYHTHFDRYLEYYRLNSIIPLYWKYIQWFHRACDSTLAPSQETLNSLQSKGIQRLKLWSRGIDCILYSPDKRSSDIRTRYNITAPLILLYVGRIAPEKDIATLTLAMQQLPEHMQSRVHWIIVGDGPLLPKMRMQSPPNVTFTGYLHGEELAVMYASADLFVFPSSTETFGNVVLEAMASGLPVLAANGGGVKDLVAHHRSGVLFEPGQADALIREICLWGDHVDQLKNMGLEGRKLAQQRSWDHIFDGLIGDYEEAIENRRRNTKDRIITA